MFIFELAAASVVGIILIAAGIIQKRKTGQKKWCILVAAGAVPVLISVLLFVCTLWLLYGIQSSGSESSSEEVIDGGDWRTYRAYSEDLSLDESGTLVFCLAMLDNQQGYAVYDSSNGARVGNLLWGEGKEADWQQWAQLKDLDHDGICEIGVPMTDGQCFWYHYREDLEGTWPENINGCFERVE